MYDPRTQEIERWLNQARIALRLLESRMAAVEQMAGKTGGGMPGGGGGGGGAYADPGLTVVAAGGEAELTVMEPRAGGSDVEIGTKTVVNRFSTATTESLRLILVKNADGSYLIVNQDYPCE